MRDDTALALSQVSIADDPEPTPERQAKLRAACEKNVKAKKPPYYGVAIRTSGELSWILQQRGWSTEPGAQGGIKPDLRDADLRSATLPGVDLRGCNLYGAILDGADLSRAKLDQANIGFTRVRISFWRRNAFLITTLSLTLWMLGLIYYIVRSLVAVILSEFGGSQYLSPTVVPSLSDPVFLITLMSFLLFMVESLLIYVRRRLRHDVWQRLQIERAIALFDLQRGGKIDAKWADLSGPNLSEASLQHANLSGIHLRRSSLRNADLRDANLSFAYLEEADLIAARLEGVNLGSANLKRSQINSVAELGSSILDSQTNLAEVTWQNVPLTRPKAGVTLDDEIAFWRDQSRVSRTVGAQLREQGLSAQAAAYRLAELRAERKAALLDGKFGSYLVSALLDLVAGYGERPGRIIASYFVVVLGFAAAFFGIAHQWDVAHAVDALVYSLTSFHGRGFFPGANVVPHDPIVVLAAVEAVAGLFIELTLIATLSKRFLGD